MKKSQGVDGGPRFLRPADAAAVLCVSTAALREWADAGFIQSIRLPSGQRRYSAASIAALAEPYVPAPAAEPVA